MGTRAPMPKIRAWCRRALASPAAALRRLGPLTPAKAAIATAALAALGVLAAVILVALSALRTSEDRDPTSVFQDLPQPRDEQAVAVSGEELRLAAGIYRVSAEGQSLTHIADEPGKYAGADPSSLSQDGRWLAFAPGPVSASTDDEQVIFIKDLSSDAPALPLAMFALIYELAISPDGGTLIVHGDIEPEVRSWPEIAPYYLIDVGSQTITPLPWLQSTSDVMWSPEGDRLSFTRRVEGGDDLFVSDLLGTVLMRARIPYPAKLAWSPDGTKLALDSYSGDDGVGTYLIDLTGNLRFLTSVRANDLYSGPQWSPDGRRLVVGSSDEAPEVPLVRTIDTATGKVVTLGSGEKPAWSRDGSRLAFLRDGNLFVMRPDGSEATQTLHPIQPFVDAPRWALDDSGILFHYSPWGFGSIRVLGPDGRERHLAHGTRPTWSPDGSKIAFIGRVPSSGFVTIYEVWVMNADGSDPHSIGEYSGGRLPDGCPFALAWSPDGRRVLHGREPAPMLASSVPPGNGPVALEDGCGTSLSVDGSVINGGRGWPPDDLPLTVLDADGAQVLQLQGHSATWSPDGSRIAYWKTGEVHVADYPSGGSRQVAGLGPNDSIFQLLWSPDGNWLAYTVGTEYEKRSLWLVGVQNRMPPVLVSDGGDVAWSPDSTRIAFADGPEVFEQEVYTADIANPRRRTKIADGSTPQWSPDGSLILFTR
jgi:Tol biopolymer transport system component